MKLLGLSDLVPLTFEENGQVVRVSGTRVTLDTIVAAFNRGATPEEIAQDFSAVSLVRVCSVISYYHRHQSEVDEYLARRAKEHAEMRREIEASPGHMELRERLLSRMRQAGAASA